MFRNTKIQRSIAAVVMATFMNLSLYPLTVAVQAKDDAASRPADETKG